MDIYLDDVADELEYLHTDYDRAEYLQNMLLGRATDGPSDNQHYQALRRYFLDNPITESLVPRWVRTNRDLSQFWQFIKGKSDKYAERRKFIWTEFSPLLEFLESKQVFPAEKGITEVLYNFDVGSIHSAWQKALERKVNDPEGAITIARTILESVCKHILDEKEVGYDSGSIKLPKLYKMTANELNLSPEQHSEQVFKQILGGCSSVVNGLGSLRNKHGDAHGQGKQKIKPAPRHAELAVNLAGAMTLFLIETFEASEGE